MSKVLVTVAGDELTEHFNKTFKEVISKVTVPTDIYLDYYSEDEHGFKVFKRRVHIGNTAENLTENDYYLAYDIVTE